MSKISFLLRIFIAIIFLIASVCIYYFFQIITIKYTGEITIKTQFLSAPIKIHTDEFGFVHIKANTRKDAMFAIGVAHARDRLFQMDFLRHFASGTLSEIVGNLAIESDTIARTIGFRRLANQDIINLILRPDHSTLNNLLSIYVEGINYWANTHHLPPEYYLLRYFKFDNWTVVDTLTLVRYMAFSLTSEARGKLINHIVLDKLGKQFFDLVYKTNLYDYPFFNESIISEREIEEMKMASKNNTFIKNLIKHNISFFNDSELPVMFPESFSSEKKEPSVNPKDGFASNSWVVSGNYTNTSKPIFSNDPHLDNSLPGTHYIVKLYITETNEVITGSIPVIVPFMIIGGNKNLAYGLTVDTRVTSDFVEEKLDNANISLAKYYYVDDKKFPLEIIEETINVKGGKPVNVQIKLTRNGPLISKLIKHFCPIRGSYTFKSVDPNKANAISWNIFSFKKTFDAHLFYNLMFGMKKEDFIDYLKSYEGPPFALQWATVEGEIGYTPIGHIGLKKNPKFTFEKGYKSEYEGKVEAIPRNEVPVYVNPKKGFIVSANNYPFPQNYKHFSTHFSLSYRQRRISEILREIVPKRNYSVDVAMSMLGDTKDLECKLLKPILVKILDNFIYPNMNEYFELLKQFDCIFSKESRAATLYDTYLFELLKHIFLKNEINDIHLGFDENYDEDISLYFHDVIYNIFKKQFNLPTCAYFNKGDNCQQFVYQVFTRIEDYLKKFNLLEKEQTGKVLVRRWADAHHLSYPHPLGRGKLLGKWLNRENPTEGTKNTIKATCQKYHKDDPFTSLHSANLKYINDLSDITRPFICLDTGNSGNFFSKYYDNLMIRCEKNQLIKIKNYQFENDKDSLVINPL